MTISIHFPDTLSHVYFFAQLILGPVKPRGFITEVLELVESTNKTLFVCTLSEDVSYAFQWALGPVWVILWPTANRPSMYTGEVNPPPTPSTPPNLPSSLLLLLLLPPTPLYTYDL